MNDTLRLTVLTGPHKCHRYCFRGPRPCVLGRMDDCSVQFDGDPHDLRISRHHCRLSLNPPRVWLEDLGSLNGTYLNGKKLPSGAAASYPTSRNAETPSLAEVQDGDLITIGPTSLRVEMVECPRDLPPGPKAVLVWADGRAIRKDCPINCPYPDPGSR